MTSTLPPIVQACSGAIGSAAANALTYPLDLVTARVQLERPRAKGERTGLSRAIEILQHITSRDGLAALYDGLWTDTGATILSNFFYFYFYSWLRTVLTTRRLPVTIASSKSKAPAKAVYKPTMLEEIILGFIAGIASRAISTPLNIITVKLQAEREDDQEAEKPQTGPKSYPTVSQIITQIYQEQGLAGFWRGFQTTILLSLNPSLTLALFQLFRRTLDATKRPPGAVSAPNPASGKKVAAPVANPKPSEAFLGAAISNSIAVTLLYPFILAKTRLQGSRASSLTQVLHDAYQSANTASQTPNELAGFQGLYQGLQTQILKGFLGQGVTFLVKGRVEQAVVSAYLRRKRAEGI